MATNPPPTRRDFARNNLEERDKKLYAKIERTEAEACDAAQRNNLPEAIWLRWGNLDRLLGNERFRDCQETQMTRRSLANDSRECGNLALLKKENGYQEHAAKRFRDAFLVIQKGRSVDDPHVIDARYEYARDLKRMPDFAAALPLLKLNLEYRIRQLGEHDVTTQLARFALAKVHERLAEDSFQENDRASGRQHAKSALDLFLAIPHDWPKDPEDSEAFYTRLHIAYVLYLLSQNQESQGHFEALLRSIEKLHKFQEHQTTIRKYIVACNSEVSSPNHSPHTWPRRSTRPQMLTPEHESDSTATRLFEQEQSSYYGRTLSADAKADPTKWVQGLRKSHKLLGISNGKVSVKYDHVKIAILDTGIDGSLLHVNCSEKIMEWKSWIAGDDPEARNVQGNRELIQHFCVDQDGHGTHLAGIIMDVNPLARLYVARVAKGPSQIDPEHVAEAIKYATQVWKVDVISMSLGFKLRVPTIERVLEDVKDVLMFAAGSNDGLHGRVAMFPASASKVIRVNSADHRGVPSGDNAEPTSFRDYTTLGVDVASLSIKLAPAGQEHAVETRSGCSVATAVMAATASLFLEFLRQEALHFAAAGNAEEKRKMQLAESELKRNMIEPILDRISKPFQSFRFIKPWALLDGGDDMQYTALSGNDNARTTILQELDAHGVDFSNGAVPADGTPAPP